MEISGSSPPIVYKRSYHRSLRPDPVKFSSNKSNCSELLVQLDSFIKNKNASSNVPPREWKHSKFRPINRLRVGLLQPFSPRKIIRFVRPPPPVYYPQKHSHTLITPKTNKIIPVKDIIRDRVWATKAKPQILNDFYEMVNSSNGVKVLLPQEQHFSYKFYLAEGNNSALLRQIFANRPHWTRVFDKEIANLVWTQTLDTEFARSLPSVADKTHELSARHYNITAEYHFIASDSSSKEVDLSELGYCRIGQSSSFATVLKNYEESCLKIQCHNKIDRNFNFCSKKGLFYNLQAYYEAIDGDVFSIMPLTFHVLSGRNFADFRVAFEADPGKTWIIKPGEHSNRGNGISICDNLEDIMKAIEENSLFHTYIIQKYIERPLLINKRKFDIRCFALLTCQNGIVQAYFYREGYLRTASRQFTLDPQDRYVHLTNDAVQKQGEDYGKFETGNKMSYNEFQKYLDCTFPEKHMNFKRDLVPEMNKIVQDTVKSVFLKIDPDKRTHTFEILGFDFIIDSEFKVWLLEVNTNPCLEASSPLLARIIPNMLENAFRIAVDPLFRDPPRKQKSLLFHNNFELVFHSLVDGSDLISKLGERSECLYQEHPAILESLD